MIHSYQGNASWHFAVVFMIALISRYVSAVDRCAANENNYYDKALDVCAVCKECRNVKARNFSEQFIGPIGSDGDEGCLPCRRPSPGYYIHVSGKHPAVFHLCMKNCAALFRQQQTPCGGFTDAVCGSCFAGYHDETNSVHLACTKIIQPTTTTVESTLATTLKETEQLSNGSVSTFEARTGALAKEEDTLSATQVIAGISCAVVAVVACLAVVLLMCLKKRLQRKLEVRQATEERSELLKPDRLNHVSITLNENPSDLTTSGLPGPKSDEHCSSPIRSTLATDRQTEESKEATEEYSRSIPRACHSHVNMSLSDTPSDLTMDGPRRTATTDRCRQELPSMQTAVVTDSHNALPYVINRPISRSMELTICKCHEQRQCECKRLSEHSKHIKVLDNMNSINIIARHICHDPKRFFQSLEVVNSKYYQTFVNIDKLEVRAEYYRNVLRGWVEIKGDQAIMADLIDALCKHHFHDICDIIAKDMHGETHLKHGV